MNEMKRLAKEHSDVTRRYFLKSGAAAVAAVGISELWAQPRLVGAEDDAHHLLREAIAKLEYLTREENFITYGRGDPPPHELPPGETSRSGTCTRDLAIGGSAGPGERRQGGDDRFPRLLGTALNWDGLMKLAEKHAVRFMSVMSCTNGRFPCGMGLWEGVPLRDVVWLARPTEQRPARLLLRLSQRRSKAEISKLSAYRPRAGGPAGRAPGDPLLQAQQPMAHEQARRAGSDAGPRRLRQQVGQMASACHADQQLPGERYVRPVEQRHRQSHKDLRRFHLHPKEDEGGRAGADNRTLHRWACPA